MYVLIFWTAKYERKSCLNWTVSPQMLPRPQLIFPSKTWFLKFYLNFQQQKSLKNQYLSTFWIQILPNKISLNPPHQDLSNNTKGTFQFLWNFQLRCNLIFSEKIIQYSSRTFCSASPNIMEPSPGTPSSSWRAFQRHQEHDLEHPSMYYGSHNYKTKQTTCLHSYIDWSRWFAISNPPRICCPSFTFRGKLGPWKSFFAGSHTEHSWRCSKYPPPRVGYWGT
jgi:hypothetical protein